MTAVRLDERGFQGPGVATLASAVDRARFVLVGEAHFSREIPRVTTALCRLMAPGGLQALAVEMRLEAAARADVPTSYGKLNEASSDSADVMLKQDYEARYVATARDIPRAPVLRSIHKTDSKDEQAREKHEQGVIGVAGADTAYITGWRRPC